MYIEKDNIKRIEVVKNYAENYIFGGLDTRIKFEMYFLKKQVKPTDPVFITGKRYLQFTKDIMQFYQEVVSLEHLDKQIKTNDDCLTQCLSAS